MSATPSEWSKVERIKNSSRYLRGQIAEELANEQPLFEEETASLLKFHGIYQQDHRDLRGRPEAEAQPGGRLWIMMIRVKIPGGRLTSAQWLALTECADQWGNQTLRITNRQDIQFHEVPKRHLESLIQRVRDIGLTTLGACGDVVRNVVACPAPLNDGGIRERLYADAVRVTSHLLPRSGAYREIWSGDHSAQDVSGGKDSEASSPASQDEEPVYGTNYLPRKFKIAFSLAEDNCIDIYANDLGFLGVVEQGKLIGYQVMVGGGLGMTFADKSTFVALSQPVCLIEPDQVVPMAEAVVRLYRDHGNRANRRRARIKYLLADWGMEEFRRVLRRYFGQELRPPLPITVSHVDHHLGWHRQADGRWFYGMFVENGRVRDSDQARMKTALVEICRRLQPGIRLTPTVSLLITDIAEGDKSLVESILRDHGVRMSEEVGNVRRFSAACVALPTCGLAVTESERALPGVIDTLEKDLEDLGLKDLRLSIRMSGCPNGCGRPYNAEVGLVGRAKDRYAVFLGGSQHFDRLAFLYEPMVPRDQIAPLLARLLKVYKAHRTDGETFGDFCLRLGPERLRALAGPAETDG
jgi:sulfite reductase (ferredoxin)